MSAVTAPVPPPEVYMPGRSHHAAPKYDGDSKTLQRFLSDVEIRCRGAGLNSDTDFIKWAIFYAPIDDAELWEGLETRKGSSWVAFKAEVLEFYPGSGSETDMVNGRDALDAFVRKHQQILIKNSRVRLENYNREFMRRYNRLRNYDLITDSDGADMYRRGFDTAFYDRMMKFLGQLESLPVFKDRQFTLKQVMEVARSVLAHGFQSYYD